MTERAILCLILGGTLAVGIVAGTIQSALHANHAEAMACICINAGGSNTRWGCFAKGVDIELSRAPLFGSGAAR